MRTVVDARHETMEIELAGAVSTVLKGELGLTVDESAIGNSISKAGASLNVSTSQLPKFMRAEIGDAMLSAYPMSLERGAAAAATVRGRRTMRNPVEALLLGRALYGSYTSFFKSLQAPQDPPQTPNFHLKRPKRQRPCVAEQIRQWQSLDEERLTILHDQYSSQIASWLQRNPDQGRKKCRDAQKRAYLFMRIFHPEWIDDVLPLRVRPIRPRSHDAQLLDKSMSDHIIRRKAELLAADVPRQIAHRHLVHGHAQASLSRAYWSQHPLTSKTLS